MVLLNVYYRMLTYFNCTPIVNELQNEETSKKKREDSFTVANPGFQLQSYQVSSKHPPGN